MKEFDGGGGHVEGNPARESDETVDQVVVPSAPELLPNIVGLPAYMAPRGPGPTLPPPPPPPYETVDPGGNPKELSWFGSGRELPTPKLKPLEVEVLVV